MHIEMTTKQSQNSTALFTILIDCNALPKKCVFNNPDLYDSKAMSDGSE